MIPMIYDAIRRIGQFPSVFPAANAVINILEEHDKIFVKNTYILQTFPAEHNRPAGEVVYFFHFIILSLISLTKSNIPEIKVLYLLPAGAVYFISIRKEDLALHSTYLLIPIHYF